VVDGSNGAISGSIISKMAADGHLGLAALSRVTLLSAGLSCLRQGVHRSEDLRHDARSPLPVVWFLYTNGKSKL